jgi:galactokinase
MSDQGTTLPPDRLASLAHEAEIVEFGEPGGMMDHLAAAHGGMHSISFSPSLTVQPLRLRPGAFVLGDSLEPKDTVGILSRVKHRVLDIVRILGARNPGFSLSTVRDEHLEELSCDLDDYQRTLLRGTVRNHAITLEARRLLTMEPLQSNRLGHLLSEHESVLRDVLKISTPKIDRMLDAAMNAGALGGKINGSGGGGCMFAYAPVDPDRVAEAIRREGGRAWVVGVGSGTQLSMIHG